MQKNQPDTTELRLAERLSVSERTIHHHIEHIYNKIGVSTRASATLCLVNS